MTQPLSSESVRRIVSHDGSMFSSDPAVQAEAAAFMGWTHLASGAATVVADVERIAADVRSEPLTDVVLLGMGGSSLAALVIARVLELPGSPRLTVLDTTSPVTVSRALASTDPATTMHLVSSKSGGTIEPNALYSIFRGRADGILGHEAAGRRFIALTDPGSSLESLALHDGMRECLLTPPDVGGRYSALTAFGLLPAALVGVDVGRLVEAAVAVERQFTDGDGDLSLAESMVKAYESGHDKLTIVAQPALRVFGLWVEQLVAESLGKGGKGIVPVVHSGPVYVDYDEVSVAFRRNSLSAGKATSPESVPSIQMHLKDPYDLGGWFVLWEYSTALVGAAMGVNPFDQPNVAEAKTATADFLSGKRSPTEPTAAVDGVEFTFAGALQPPTPLGTSISAGMAGVLDSVRDGDYVAVLAYVPDIDDSLEPLVRAAAAVSETGIATCLEVGPRYLHSTGQLHKGGPDTGMFVMVTTHDTTDIAVPGQTWSLGALHRAQAEGDLAALAAHGRRVVRVELPDASPANVQRFASALIEAALSHDGISPR